MTILDTARKYWNMTPKKVVTTQIHRLVYDLEAAQRLHAAQGFQSEVYDAVAEHLRHHPNKPWIATANSGKDSILKWLTREKDARHGWGEHSVHVLRGAARDAFEATRRWDEHQQALAESVLKEQEAEEQIRLGKAPHPNDIEDEKERGKHQPSARLVRVWTKGPSQTGRREERTAAVRLLEAPRVLDAHTISVNGLGRHTLHDPVAQGTDVRSCQFVETTREGIPTEKKRYRVHIQTATPVAKTRRRRHEAVDLGKTHTIATKDGAFFDRPDTSALEKKAKELLRHFRKHGTVGSLRWREVQEEARKLREKARNIQGNWEYHVARMLARSAGRISIESLAIRNMMGSGRGTVSAPGTQAKRGLNRVLGEAGLSRLVQKLVQQCLKAGTNLVMVHPGNTSITCHRCKHKDKKSRKGERFECTACGHKAHADTNAAKNISERGDRVWKGYWNALRKRTEKTARAKGTKGPDQEGRGEALDMDSQRATGHGGGEPLRASTAQAGELLQRHLTPAATGPPVPVESSI